MKIENLPNDIEALKNIIIKKNEEIQGLHDLVAMLRRKKFSSSSEKISSEQLGLFDEAESTALKTEPEENTEEDDKSNGKILIPEHERKRGKRFKLPDSLPRVDIIIDVDNKTCSQDHQNLKYIGDEVSEKLDIIPSKVQVLRTIRRKYSCSTCENIIIPDLPLELIPKSNASSSLLAFIATSKYVDALPLYRQESIFNRININLSRQTMARWMIKVGELITPLITLLREELLKSNYIFMDETTVQVLKEDGKSAQSKSYMWVQGRAGNKPIILFHYAKNRSGIHPEELLEDFNLNLHIDGYDGYSSIIKKNKITRLGCWAHARRKFFDAFKSSSGKSIGKQGLIYFDKIYEIEKRISELTFEKRFYERLIHSIPIIKNLKKWVDENIVKVTPSSMAGMALNYISNEWSFLLNCFCSGEFRIDNNWIESHIRPFTIGRKNWMFSVTPEGATASANIYSLVETAKANNLEPFEYLNMVFTKLPIAKTENDFLDLLPVKIER